MSGSTKKPPSEYRLQEELWKIVEKLDDDIHYNYPEAVRDVEMVFGVTATRNAIRLEKRKGKPLTGALKVIAEAVGEGNTA